MAMIRYIPLSGNNWTLDWRTGRRRGMSRLGLRKENIFCADVLTHFYGINWEYFDVRSCFYVTNISSAKRKGGETIVINLSYPVLS